MLDQKELKRILKYNQKTGKFIYNINRGPMKKGDYAGYKNHKGYEVICISGKLYMSHRLVYLYMTSKFPKETIDHINHNKIDNRWKNLRNCKIKDNSKNQSLSKNNKSGFTGVEWSKRDKNWMVRITIEGKRKYLGSYLKFSDAVKVRKLANIKHNYHKNHGK